MNLEIKLTYAPNKHVILNTNNQVPGVTDARAYAITKAAFDAHVQLKRFWAVFTTVIIGLVVTVCMVWIDHINPTAALDFMGFLGGSLIAHHYVYGKAYDKINALMKEKKSE